jgi:hypothetical protein
VTRVCIVAEGQTERAFVSSILAPSMAERGVYVTAQLIGSRGHRGGNVGMQRLKRDIVCLLRQDRESICSTMFDYYGLAPDFPGKSQSDARRNATTKAEAVEAALRDAVQREMGSSFDPRRFVPYVQMHEFEGLLFSDPVLLAGSLNRPESERQFREIREFFESPEDINDGYETCPSRRIMGVHSRYDKPAGGMIAAKAIGLRKMREECPHFAAWLTKLGSLGSGV